ncbi:aspartyl protease [Aphanothece hegewaldii CCALA 016]|uniref:Aspartyl protease n=1 Tax=Aphanothece hegewaldii CCALA 016 TaxID=2107694 RepID=A0A2T1LZ89_9CHRO|nr:aspartyl protease [Aphanothece hegewaldii]PSF37656.1 aspartyl protease [Aphanothece hegewaldii CCALA 016]
MIRGRFGENGQIYFEIDLIDNVGENLAVEAMLDTGFTEFLAMNQQDIDSLEWSFLGQDKLMTAQGEATFNIYLGRLAIDEQVFEIPVFAGSEIQKILLGSQWLKQFTLIVRYSEGRVTLEKE